MFCSSWSAQGPSERGHFPEVMQSFWGFFSPVVVFVMEVGRGRGGRGAGSHMTDLFGFFKRVEEAKQAKVG